MNSANDTLNSNVSETAVELPAAPFDGLVSKGLKLPEPSPVSPQGSSSAKQYLDGLMMAIPVRESLQKVTSKDVPPTSTGDVIADSEATRKWSEEVLRRSQQEFAAAKKQLDAIRARIGDNLQSLPPQVRSLMEFVIETERQILRSSMPSVDPPGRQTPPAPSQGAPPPLAASRGQEQPEPKMRIPV